MIDNQSKAVLFGNDFQSFLISSQSVLGQSHSISAILAERVLCQIPCFVCEMWFSVWNLHFSELEYEGHMLVFVPREMAWEMPRFKSLPNLILSKISIPDHAQSAVRQSLIQGLSVPSGTDCWESAAPSCPHQAKSACAQGRNSCAVSDQGLVELSSLSPMMADSACTAKSVIWRQMYSDTSPKCSPGLPQFVLGDFLRQT